MHGIKQYTLRVHDFLRVYTYFILSCIKLAYICAKLILINYKVVEVLDHGILCNLQHRQKS